MRVVIIGTGNVATVLGKKMRLAEHDILQVYGRQALHAELLADTLNTQYTNDLTRLDDSADLYVMAVSDAGIPALSKTLQLHNKLVVHTAGSVSMEVLQNCSTNYGILYPLQSLRREMTALPEIPFLVDANTPDNRALIADFASTLSNQVQCVSDEQRLRLHVAAVVVSNFTNHLYALAQQYCVQEKVDFALLLPLINAIAERLYEFAPAEVQTGPAVRNDAPTIEKHLQVLEKHPALKELYVLFTKSIQNFHQ
jgi:predicted short-subunit dehydrogenase-like oxidoreductase (DUF2520 family)